VADQMCIRIYFCGMGDQLLSEEEQATLADRAVGPVQVVYLKEVPGKGSMITPTPVNWYLVPAGDGVRAKGRRRFTPVNWSESGRQGDARLPKPDHEQCFFVVIRDLEKFWGEKGQSWRLNLLGQLAAWTRICLQGKLPGNGGIPGYVQPNRRARPGSLPSITRYPWGKAKSAKRSRRRRPPASSERSW